MTSETTIKFPPEVRPPANPGRFMRSRRNDATRWEAEPATDMDGIGARLSIPRSLVECRFVPFSMTFVIGAVADYQSKRLLSWKLVTLRHAASPFMA